MNQNYVIFVFFFNFLAFVSSEDVLGCGGFVKSHVPIDYSKVEIKLVTKQGIIKDKTNCAPNNGYYFVPLYDKGELILELSPPAGWSFSPKQVLLNVDGTDSCSLGKDINFVFEGFGITGKVESLNSANKGPKDVTVELTSKEGKSSTKTKADGSFFFTPVFPGLYIVSISHPKWKIYKKSIEVKVAEGNTELPSQSLVIQGYDVKGRVTTSEGAPIKATTVVLFQNDEKKNALVDGCNKNELKGLQIKTNFLCHVTSNSAGEFTFPTVPNGKYFVISYYEKQNIYFQPEKIEFTVDNESVELDTNFKVVGFSIPGKVLNGKNHPIPNAKIFLNGQAVTTSDKNGAYKLEKLKSGTYKLRAEADDVIFEEVIFKIDTDSQNLPDLVPSAFKVCGTVTSDKSQILIFSKIGSTKFVQTQTNSDGEFCQYLSSGKYEVQVNVNDADKQKGLQFFPLKQTVEVAAEKITDLLFSQLKATITGKVECIRKTDCSGLSVILNSDLDVVTIPLQQDLSYIITDMHPGIYEVSISSNKCCWKAKQQTVNVNSATVKVPPFVQTGYSLNIISSHDAKMLLKSPDQKTKLKHEILRGVTSLCLEKHGAYVFQLESCHSFDDNSLTYNTDSENNEIKITAQKHTSKLAIQSDGNYGDLKVSVIIDQEQSEQTLQYDNGKYALELMLGPSETAIITPKSDFLYFTPPSLSIEGSTDCEDLGVKLVAVKGKVFQGKVIPPLAGVTIKVEGPNKEELTAQTDVNGLYKFKPLNKQNQYTLSARKESYVLTGPDSSGNFKAHKLAEVVVEVIDGADKSPLPGVLLSLSGEESYRRNLQTALDGKISFHSLSPSEYFLRPMMKEYQFNPNSKIIQVKEGETVNVQLIGKRVAYSAFGKVTSLNGDPSENMIVIASGLSNCSQYSEESITDSAGYFRIRGLQPFCSYNIYVKIGSKDESFVERTAPKFVEIRNIKKDEKGLNIIVFRPVTVTDVLAKVYADNVDHYRLLKIKLHRENGGGSVLVHTGSVDSSGNKITKENNNGILVYLPSVPLDQKTYSLQLDTTHNLKYKSDIQYFNTNSSFKYIELHFDVKSNITEQPIKQTSVWTIVFIFGVLFGGYNIQLIADLLKDHFNFNISCLTNLLPNTNNTKNVINYYDNAQIDEIVQKINAVKKKPPKKN